MISMAEAVQLLKITYEGQPNGSAEDLIPTDRIDVNLLCPACAPMHQSRRETLNINFEKNQYNCPRCRFSGGVKSFISYYTGWDKKDVEKRLRGGELGQTSLTTGEFRAEDSGNSAYDRMIASIAQRDEAYRALQKRLSLSPQHRENLLERGLSEERIDLLGYKSTPLFLDVTAIPKQLIAQGIDLRGVPGFGIGNNGDWALARMPAGFLIPGKNAAKMLQGFQIRADHPSDSIPRYSSLSSRKMAGGTAGAAWCHWAGNDLAAVTNKPFDIFVIEGWLKGDICHFLTGENFLCVPGTNALGRVLPALHAMRKRGLVREVFIAYDMDAYANKEVAKQLVSLYFMLTQSGFKARILQWNQLFKGLDNWLHESGEYDRSGTG